MQTKQDILDYLTWTYFFRRLLENPSYYQLESLEPKDINRFLSCLVQNSLDTLAAANCVEIHDVIIINVEIYISLLKIIFISYSRMIEQFPALLWVE